MVFPGRGNKVVIILHFYHTIFYSKNIMSLIIFIYPFSFQVGGYAVEYENLIFVTVRGAGHFVPSYQPGRAFTMFSSFINGTLPPGVI